MSRLLRPALAACLLAACAGSPPATVSVPVVAIQPVASASSLPAANANADAPPDPPSPLAAEILDAAAVVLAAARGTLDDTRYDCADATTDIRATGADVHAAMVGDGAHPSPLLLLAGLEDVVLAAPAADGASTFEVQADVIVWPDGRVRFVTLRPSKHAGGDPSETVPVDSLPPAVHGLADSLVAGLKQCAWPTLTAADAASLPLGEDERDEARARIPKDAAAMQDACHAAVQAKGPWSIAAKSVIAFVRIGDEPVMLSAATQVSGDHLCLGPVGVDGSTARYRHEVKP